MMAKLPPGKHNVDLHFYDASGRELRDMRQVGLDLNVPEKGDAVLLARSNPRYRIEGASMAAADPYAGLAKKK
jgi:hypothetical protein